MRPFPIGIDDFRKLRENDYYYADKTMFIKEFLDNRGEVRLFTRYAITVLLHHIGLWN